MVLTVLEIWNYHISRARSHWLFLEMFIFEQNWTSWIALVRCVANHNRAIVRRLNLTVMTLIFTFFHFPCSFLFHFLLGFYVKIMLSEWCYLTLSVKSAKFLSLYKLYFAMTLSLNTNSTAIIIQINMHIKNDAI